MNKAVERDLLSLLPSITLPLPRELVEVAISLLSQSRSKASSLRQDEEIARGYVCANIACDRLRTKLNLPTIIVRPPVAPKIYKKVYAYLDSALTAGTPRKQQRNDIAGRSEPSTPSKSRLQPANGTPSRTPVRTPQARTPATAQSSTKRKHAEIESEGDMPSWVMPTIRSLCKALEIPYTAPHVYVGVSSISRVIREQQASVTSTPSKKRVRRTTGNDAISTVVSEFEEAHVPALIVVVGFFTLSHLQGPPRPEDYVKLRKKAVDAVTRSTPDEVRKDDDSTIAAVEALLREAENGWLDMEWYQNLPQPVADSGEATDETNGAATEFVEDEERPIQRLELPKRGFGSMMTDTTDWLSDERRADYRHWKAGILNKIALVQKQDKEKRIK